MNMQPSALAFTHGLVQTTQDSFLEQTVLEQMLADHVDLTVELVQEDFNRGNDI